jgi:hypothetical protein
MFLGPRWALFRLLVALSKLSFPVGWLASSNASPQTGALGAHFVRPQPPDSRPRIDGMTTFEHAMLAINGCLATGMHRRQGWSIVALAACSAVVPDWDGLTLVSSAEFFDRAHRTWGHCLLVSLLLAIALGIGDYRFDFTGRWARLLQRLLRLQLVTSTLRADRQRSYSGYAVWSTVSVIATLSHLAGDVVFSGGAGLPDWQLKLFWPFSERGFVYPLVPWGDAGVTLLFAAGMFAMYRWRARVSLIAGAILGMVVLYAVLRGTIIGEQTRHPDLDSADFRNPDTLIWTDDSDRTYRSCGPRETGWRAVPGPHGTGLLLDGPAGPSEVASWPRCGTRPVRQATPKPAHTEMAATYSCHPLPHAGSTGPEIRSAPRSNSSRPPHLTSRSRWACWVAAESLPLIASRLAR